MSVIVPCFFTVAFLEIVESFGIDIKKLMRHTLMFIPTVAYSLLVFYIRVPKSRMDLIQNVCNENANFPLRQDVFEYFWNDRSNIDIWGRQLHAIPVVCVIYPLFLVIIITILLWNADKKKIAIVYLNMCILTGIFNYLIVIVAWDLHRYYWCIYMQIFLVTIYILKRCLRNYKLHRHEMIYLILMILAYIGMGSFEFRLFDGAVYLRTVNEMQAAIFKFGL